MTLGGAKDEHFPFFQRSCQLGLNSILWSLPSNQFKLLKVLVIPSSHASIALLRELTTSNLVEAIIRSAKWIRPEKYINNFIRIKEFHILRYVKFINSVKATKFCEISTNHLTGSTKDWWRFRKNFWPSQNIWTLIGQLRVGQSIHT